MDKEKQSAILIQESNEFRKVGSDTGQVAQQAILRITEKLKFRNYVLAVSHSNYLVSLGGTERVLHGEQAELEKRNISYIQVYYCNSYDKCVKKEYFDQLVGVNVDSVPVGNFTIVQIGLILQLLNLSQAANAVAIHIHHLMGLSILGVKCLINTIQAQKLRFFLHDYYTICPQFNLLKDDKVYCGGPPVDSKDCRECKWGEKRSSHFSMVKTILNSVKADFVIPSRIAATIWSRSFPEHVNNIQVVPHQISRKINKNRTICLKRLNDSDYRPKIAYVGYESVNKGCHTWWRVTSEMAVKGDYRFFHLGASSMSIPGVNNIPVSFLDEGADAMVKTLRKHQIDIAFLWSICPETYSFTLYEAFAAGCFVVTNSLSGNIAAQIKGSRRGIVFSDETEMFRFFSDAPRVKEAIRLNLRENSTCELAFNPQLTIELTDGLNMKESQYVDREVRNIFHKNTTRWYYLLRKLEVESIRADHIEDIEDLDLNYDRTADIHRIVEHLRRSMDRYLLLGRIMRKTFPLVWRIFNLLRRKSQKFRL